MFLSYLGIVPKAWAAMAGGLGIVCQNQDLGSRNQWYVGA